MKTGRFLTRLENDILVPYQTKGAEDLLNKDNLATVYDLNIPGEYSTIFPDDMALTLSRISLVTTEAEGRSIALNDTVIVKFDLSDREQLLEAIQKIMLPRMREFMKKDGFPGNPLPEVKI